MAIVVYGASGGIGSALCRELSERGESLVLAGRDEAKLAETASDLETSAHTVALDAADPEQVPTAIAQAEEAFGTVTGVANCVGSLLLKPAHRTHDEEWRDTVSRNLDAAFYIVRSAVPALRREGGAIVLVSTAAARVGIPNHEAIAAAKGGVIGLTLSAAATYASRGIRVNCVAPGLTDTPLAEPLTSSEQARQASEAMHALGRLGRPEEVAAVMAQLLGPDSTWTTGQVIGVDGGLATVRPPMRG